MEMKNYFKCVIKKSNAWDVTVFKHWDLKSTTEDISSSAEDFIVSAVVVKSCAETVKYIASVAYCRVDGFKFINVHLFWTGSN